MMKRLQLFCTSLLLIGLFSLLGTQKASATHVMGSDITYRCLSPGKFEVTVKMYRDCRGVSMSTISLTVKSSAGTVNVPMTRTGIADVTPVCSKVSNPCNPANTYGTGKGIEEHTFVGTINFNNSPFNSTAWTNACEVTFGFGQCCRNGAITTGQSNANFYAEAMLNKCRANCNNAPKLTNPPIAFVCCTQPFFFNNGASDTSDFDSLSYELVAPLSAQNSTISYATSNLCGKPFSAAMPMTPFLLNPCGPHVPKPNLDPPQGFYLDPITGDIIFTPNECNEVGVVVIKVTEWRKDTNDKYQIIGETRRDIQMWVENCPANNPPKVLGPYSYSVCPGDQLCFNVTTKDDAVIPPPPATPPPPDTVTLSWNRGIPGASFTITNPTARLKTGQFCWTPGENQVSSLPYTFTATARDDACPINASATRGYSVLVKQRAKATRDITALICGAYELKSTPLKNYGGMSYDWAIRDSFDNDPPIFFSSKQLDTFQFTKGGKYIITHTVNYTGNCPTTYKDTITVPDLLEVEFALKDTFLCEGYDLKLKATVTNGLAPFKYTWETGNPADTNNTYTIAIPQDTVLDKTIAITVVDGNGCSAIDSAHVFKKPVPRVDIGPDRRICDYDSIHIGLIADTFNTKFVPTPYTYSWNTGNPNDTLDSIVLKAPGVYVLQVVDSLGCPGYDTMQLYVNDHVTADAGPDVTQCANDTVTVIGKTGDVFKWTRLSDNVVLGNDDTLNKYMSTPPGQEVNQDWELKVSITVDTTTCYDLDTVHIKINPLPVISIPKPLLTQQCYGLPDINLNAFGTSPVGGNWYYHPNQSLITGTTFKANEAVGDPYKTKDLPVTYVYTDVKGCRDSASSIVRINELPPVLVKDTVYCDNAGIQPLSAHVIKPVNPLGNQVWRALTAPDPITSVGGGPPYSFNPKSGLKGMGNPNRLEYKFENILTGCSAKDTAFIRVIPVPVITFGQSPELCADEPLQNLTQLLNAQPQGGKWVCLNCNGFNPIANDSVTFNPGAKITGYTYNLQYRHTATGCLTTNEIQLKINRLPTVKVDKVGPMCQNGNPVLLKASESVGTWTGVGVQGTSFNPQVGSVTKDGLNEVVFTYKDPTTGCQDSDTIQIYVEALPTVSIDAPRPYEICEDDTFVLNAAYSYASGITWSSPDGNVMANMSSIFNVNNVTYVPDEDDKVREQVTLVITTKKDANDVCPAATDNILLSILEIPVAAKLDKDSGCQEFTTSVGVTELDNRALTLTDVNYKWDFGEGKGFEDDQTNNPVIHTWEKPGIYNIQVVVDNKGKCFDTTYGIIEVYENPVASFVSIPADGITTLAIPEFTFINTSTGGAKPYTTEWTWGDGSPKSINPEDPATMRVTHTYTVDDVSDTGNRYTVLLKVTTAEGCVSAVPLIVTINPDITIYIPNAFTPEKFIGREENNFFYPIGQGYTDGQFQVFNRWGEKLYETTFEKGDLNAATRSNKGGNSRYQQIGWDGTYKDGTKAPNGVYVYVVKARSFSGEEYTYTGSFHLIR